MKPNTGISLPRNIAAPTKAAAPAVYGSDAAPVVYFDGVVAWGLLNGVMQVELAANHLLPTSLTGDAEVKTRAVMSAHLRCNLVAAQQLRDMLDAAIRQAMTASEKAN